MELALLAQVVTIGLMLMYISAFVCAVEVILNGRTSQGAIAWTISLLTLPMLSLPLYLIFGRNRFDGLLRLAVVEHLCRMERLQTTAELHDVDEVQIDRVAYDEPNPEIAFRTLQSLAH